jgi:hypothetical protein
MELTCEQELEMKKHEIAMIYVELTYYRNSWWVKLGKLFGILV